MQMIAPRHLRNAPITEAVVDLRVKLPDDLSFEKLALVNDSIVSRYPKRKERRKYEGKVEFRIGEPPKQTTVDKGPDGYIYTSEDDKQVVQFRLDGFTFSRLKPYETWENLRDEAHKLWQLYVKFSSPEFITRVALRYINNLNIPLPIKDFAEYLVAPPTVPAQLPQGVGSFLTRIVTTEPKLGASAIVTQALEPLTQKDFAPIILDIDVFKTGQFDIEKRETWDILEGLHNLKNEIFFSSVSEKGLRLYE